MARGKDWSYEEITYLKDNWRELNLATLCKNLKRTKCAVTRKAYLLGLDGWLKCQDDISVPQLFKLIYKSNITMTTYNKWKKYGLPIRKVAVRKSKLNMVSFEDFLKWFKNNLHLIDISKTEEGDFGAIEPEWLKEKRKADKMASRYFKLRRWTKAEDEKLIHLLKQFKYTYREIGKMMQASEAGINNRLRQLGIKERPLRVPAREWTEEEKAIVKDMYLKGYRPCVISDFVNRSQTCIRGFLGKHKYFKGEPTNDNESKNY